MVISMRAAVRHSLPGLVVILLFLFIGSPCAMAAEAGERSVAKVPLEEYPIYDRVITSKFLASASDLVVIERDTVTTLVPGEQDVPVAVMLRDRQVFEDRLPAALLADFLAKLKQPSRLESRFTLDAPYRFLSPGGLEQPEVSRFVLPVSGTRSVGSPVGILSLSRVGFTAREDQALVYVGQDRDDGSGTGLLVWLFRQGTLWLIRDTEVLWVARPLEP